MAIAVANKWAKNHRADGGYTLPERSPARERAAEVLSRGRGQGRTTDLNLTPMPEYGAPGGPLDTRPGLDWLPQQMGPDTTMRPGAIRPNYFPTARGGRRDSGGSIRIPPIAPPNPYPPGAPEKLPEGYTRSPLTGGLVPIKNWTEYMAGAGRAPGGAAPTVPTYQTAAPNINAQGFVPVPQGGSVNLDLTSGALTPGSQDAIRGLAQRGLPIAGPAPAAPAAAAPQGGIFGNPSATGAADPNLWNFTPGGPNETDAQSQAWFQQWANSGSGGGTATGGRIERRAGGGGLSMSMESPWWSRSQAHGENTHPTGLIPGMGGGRQDNVPMNLAQHSHVLPADVVAGWGQGNPAQGSVNIEHALRTGPFGTGLPKVPTRPPRGLSPGRMPRLASGGNAEGVRTLVSPAEMIISPQDVHRIGAGDFDKGHDWLDRFIVHSRKQIIAHQRSLPGPVKG